LAGGEGGGWRSVGEEMRRGKKFGGNENASKLKWLQISSLFFLNEFFFNKKKKNLCHMGRGSDEHLTLVLRVALLFNRIVGFQFRIFMYPNNDQIKDYN